MSWNKFMQTRHIHVQATSQAPTGNKYPMTTTSLHQTTISVSTFPVNFYWPIPPQFSPTRFFGHKHNGRMSSLLPNQQRQITESSMMHWSKLQKFNPLSSSFLHLPLNSLPWEGYCSLNAGCLTSVVTSEHILLFHMLTWFRHSENITAPTLLQNRAHV